MTFDLLLHYLRIHKIQEYTPTGEKFNPEKMEALVTTPFSEYPV